MKYGLLSRPRPLNSPYFTATDRGGDIRKIDQIDGILRMVEEDRYCVDISTQLMATQALIARINADVLKAHIEGCVTSAIESGDEDLKAAKLAEIERVVDKLSK